MSGVVVEVRVKEGQDVKKGDPIAGTYISILIAFVTSVLILPISLSPERDEGMFTKCSRI